ncbi:hypothetical protein [Rhizobium sp. NZLR11]|uniref:hypothetical protein n=1 Tax=Rhizobium sp. NZLR11 TaxID=2731098 RepID=UPI0021809EFF|nr:hypothetical protein [Rhizobium sp. NZLR11]
MSKANFSEEFIANFMTTCSITARHPAPIGLPATHVNDGFVFLGYRIIRKRGAHGRMSVVTTIPKEKAKGFVRRLTETFSGNHSVSTVDMIASLNRQLVGWATQGENLARVWSERTRRPRRQSAATACLKPKGAISVA